MTACSATRRHALGILGLVLAVARAGRRRRGARCSRPTIRCRATSRQGLKPPGTPGPSARHRPARPRPPLARALRRPHRALHRASARVLLTAVVGGLLGLLAGFFGGWPGAVLMRIADVQLSFPFILLALTINAIVGLGLRNIIISLSVAGWVVYARVVRGEVLSVKQREFVQAAAALGIGRAPRAVPPRPAQRGAVDHRRGEPPVLAVHRGRGGDLVPRLRRAAADPGVGQHALGEPRLSSTWRGGWPPSRARRSPSPRSASTWSATGCATCSTRSSASEHRTQSRRRMLHAQAIHDAADRAGRRRCSASRRSPPRPADAQDRARTKEVIVAFAAEPRSLLPNTIVDWTTNNQVEHMYDRLVDRDPKTLQARARCSPPAGRWSTTPRGSSRCAQGVKFHNGEPFNAAVASRPPWTTSRTRRTRRTTRRAGPR